MKIYVLFITSVIFFSDHFNSANSSKENDEEISTLTPSRTCHAVSPTRSYTSYKSRSLRSQALNLVCGGNP